MDTNQADVVLVSMEGMQAMYISGELVLQQPQLSIESVLEELGVPFISHFLSNSCNPVVRRGIFPVQFNRIVLENDAHVSKVINGGING